MALRLEQGGVVLDAPRHDLFRFLATVDLGDLHATFGLVRPLFVRQEVMLESADHTGWNGGDVGETVEFTREGAGASSLTFARLAWPGYTAAVDGVPVPVEEGPAGLLVVELPDDVRGGTLTLSWSPPGSTVSLAAAALGAVAALALGGMEYRRRRTTADDDAGLGNEARAAGTQEN